MLKELEKRFRSIEKKLRSKILYNAGPLVGLEATCCHLLGIDYINGDLYYKAEDGTWQLFSFGGGGGASSTLPYKSVNTTYNIVINDYTIDAVGDGTFTVSLPTAVGIIGKIFNIRNSGTTGIITLAAFGAETISGMITANTQIIDPGDSLQVQSTGTNWIII